jgi:predicted RNase H-like HicB family nuclease
MCAGEAKRLSYSNSMRNVCYDRSQSPGRGPGYWTLEEDRKGLGAMSRARMAKAMSTYTVIVERDQTGWWVASVKGVRGCHTQGRTIEQTRRRIREALSLFVADAEKAKLVEDIKLPASARNLVNQVRSTRQRAEEEQAKLNRSTALAAQVLTGDLGVSVRDAGELLGLSHQRIHQLTAELSLNSRKSKPEANSTRKR